MSQQRRFAFVGRLWSPGSAAIAWAIDCRPNDAVRLAADAVTSASAGQLGGLLGVVGRVMGVKGTEPLIAGSHALGGSQILAATTRWQL
jgi:hypothetical protein